jgi:hypothetical protein
VLRRRLVNYSFRLVPDGRPGSRGSRGSARLKRGACSEGTRRKPDTDGRANQSGFARRRAHWPRDATDICLLRVVSGFVTSLTGSAFGPTKLYCSPEAATNQEQLARRHREQSDAIMESIAQSKTTRWW